VSSTLNVTALYLSGRDGKWYVTVRQGDNTFEHLRIHRANVLEDIEVVRREAADMLGRQFGIPKAKAARMIASVSS
jgi:hypothetical protein